MIKRQRGAHKYYIFLIVGSYLYLTNTLLAPLGTNTYQLSANKLHLLQLSIVTPIIIIWSVIFFGAVKLKTYTSHISESKDGRALNKLSNGVMTLAIGLVFSSLFSSLRPWYVAHPSLKLFTITNNYLAILYPLVAFGFLYAASIQLLKIQRSSQVRAAPRALIVLAIMAIAWLYTSALFNNPYRNATPEPTKLSSYYLSDTALVATIVIPNIVIWLLGFLSAFNLLNYARAAKGAIYKKALRYLVGGLITITVFSMVLAFMATISYSLLGWRLRDILLIIYAIVIFYALGYFIVAYAANKLSLIEEA